MAQALPKIFLYDHFRTYLKDYYQAMKSQTPFFSYRYFSKMAGFRSPNFLKLVTEGERNLSSDSLEKFVKALKLKPAEGRFFRLLVLHDQATTTEEKDHHARQILKTKARHQLKPLAKEQYDYYSDWFTIPLREMVARDDFQDDPQWIAQQFVFPVSEKQIQKAFKNLQKLGLIQKDQNGRWRQTDQSVTTGDEVVSSAVLNYHKEMLRLAGEALDKVPSKQRDISSITMGVNAQTMQKIKRMIQDFRKQVMAVVLQDDHIEDVIQLNFQLVPLIQKKEGETRATL